jgi:hypothetical protein
MVLLATVVMLAAATASGQDLNSARKHFEAGSQAYAKGDFPRAEVEFRAAFAITKDPLLYYNIGQSQQQRGHLEDAIKSYKAYLAGVPDAEDRVDVEKLIRKLEADLAGPPTAPPMPLRPLGPDAGPAAGTTGTTPERPAAPASQPEDDHRSRRQVAWITGGAALVLVVVGGVMSGLSSSKASDANKLLSQRDAGGLPLRFSTVADQYNSAKDDAAKYGGVAIAMYSLAAVAAGVSVYLFLTGKSGPATAEKPQARLRLVPELSPRSAGLFAGVEF